MQANLIANSALYYIFLVQPPDRLAPVKSRRMVAVPVADIIKPKWISYHIGTQYNVPDIRKEESIWDKWSYKRVIYALLSQKVVSDGGGTN